MALEVEAIEAERAKERQLSGLKQGEKLPVGAEQQQREKGKGKAKLSDDRRANMPYGLAVSPHPPSARSAAPWIDRRAREALAGEERSCHSGGTG